jgi:diguanylate cyclase (GGDEF)-like protein/PAS domain S-box-containing protein
MEFEKITGYLKEEIEGKKSIVDFVHPAERDRIKQYNNARLSGRDCLPRNYESKLIDRDGNVKDVFITVGFIPFAKKIIVSLTDITLRKSAQKELENLYAELLKSHNKLKQLSLRDQQTGLYNHRYLEEILEAEFYRARRDAHPVSLIMIDIDYFKSINDVYGHSFGDLVIHQFASQLKLSVRKYDILIRFGGEEFIIISPNINKAKAVVMAQRLLDSVNLHNFGDKKNLIKIKLSISVTSYPEDKAVKSMDLVEVSARILDKAKEEGGNKVATIQDIAKSKRSSVLDIKKHTDIKSLQLNLVKLNKRANQNLIEAIFAFARTLELKDHYTGFHVEKTVTYATQIAKAMKLCDEEVSVIRQAAMLHDLGKIGVSEKILLKRSRLTKSEFQEIKKHPNIGADIIRPIQLLHAIVPLILYHHERWDGKGYPTGLKRDEIPIGARVIAVADVYQALTSDRPYRKALTKLKAMEIIRRGSGTQFDPNIVATFLKILSSERKK